MRWRMRPIVAVPLRLAVAAALAVAMIAACPFAFSDASRAWADVPIEQTGPEYFFEEGKYLNMSDKEQNPPFSPDDFEVSGGRMVKTEKSENLADDPYPNMYEKCMIKPTLVGRDADDGVSGWAFVTDGRYEDAEGAWFEVTYAEVGYLEDAGDPSYRIPVDVKVRYSIAQAVSSSDSVKYAENGFDGRAAVHVSDWFSYGVYQIGVVRLDATYAFFDHNTGQLVPLDGIYVTVTSMDKGEGMGVETGRVKRRILSDQACATKSDPQICDMTRWDTIQGSYVYDKTGEIDSGKYVFVGAPYVCAPDDYSGAYYPGTYPEYTDAIGSESYYWRSGCMFVGMEDLFSLTVSKYAVGAAQWTGDAQLSHDPSYDGEGYNNLGMCFQTTNFLPLTNPLPRPPAKTINGGSGPVEGVGIGDIVTYAVSQQVVDLGHDGLEKYRSFKFFDELPEYVELESWRVLDGKGAEVPEDAGFFSQEGNTVSYEFSGDWLAEGMVYDGGTYTFEVAVRVVDQPVDDLERVCNDATVEINGRAQTTNEVEYVPIHPELDIEKHAVLDYNLASAISEYEYLSHERHDEFSTVHYTGVLSNVTDKTRAHEAVVRDDLPPGLKLVPGSVKVAGVEGAAVSEADDGTCFQVDIPSLDPLSEGVCASFEYDCFTTDEGNGLEVVNTVEGWAPNVEEGRPGSLGNHAADDGEVYINDPLLSVSKSVGESPIQNEDYQRGEEYRVGDEISYAVTLANDAPGTFAKNVRLSDEGIPNGLELVEGSLEVSGLDREGAGCKIPYPIPGESDSTHGEEETRTMEWALSQTEGDGSWGWHLDINYLDCNRPVTVSFAVRATEEVNGWEIGNRARATADNQPGDVYESDEVLVWINTPEFDLGKAVRQTESTYQVGDAASYDVVLDGLRTPGTLARRTILEDAFQTEGTTIVEGSFVISDLREDADDIRERVDLNRHVGDQSWHIDVDQVYGDGGYWVSAEDFRYVWSDGSLVEVEGERNPAGVAAHDYLKVHYEATINDAALQNELVRNVARADSLEGFSVEDEAEVSVIGARLSIEKDSIDRGAFEVGGEALYILTVENGATGTTARNVRIEDGFSTVKAGAVEMVDGSMQVKNARGETVEGWEVTWRDNEAGGHIGFVLDTKADLRNGDKLVVSYKVKYLSNNGSSKVVNVAKASADNAPEVQDDYETWPADADQSLLIVDKGSDKQRYAGGDKAVYTLHITNGSDAVAENVVIHDAITLDTLGIARVVKGSVKVFDEQGGAVPARVVYGQAASGIIGGFSIETGCDLAPSEAMDVTYEVAFGEPAQDTPVNNEAWVAADNTGRATDEHEVAVIPEGCKPPHCDDPCDPDGPCDPIGPCDPGDPCDPRPDPCGPGSGSGGSDRPTGDDSAKDPSSAGELSDPDSAPAEGGSDGEAPSSSDGDGGTSSAHGDGMAKTGDRLAGCIPLLLAALAVAAGACWLAAHRRCRGRR